MCISFASLAAPLVLLEQTEIARVKTALKNATAMADTQKAYQLLLQQADKALDLDGFSVTDKKIMPPSKDHHDYLSISRYWWPDETKVDGLPWKRRDGITNPDTQTDHVDRKRLGAMSRYVSKLSYAYYFSGNEKYAQKGTALIKKWFLDSDTKMNPHLEFAQTVPGRDQRRRSGILDGRLIPEKILDAITLFTPSKHWSENDNQKMNLWLSDYLSWLTNSKMGQAGAKQINNHGSWYYFQVAALSWYLGDSQGLKTSLEQSKIHMLSQFDQQGAQQHELARTRAFFYSCFNLEALTSIAIIADKAGDSLWRYPATENSLLATGVEYLIPAAQGQTWPHASSNHIDPTDFIRVLERYNQYSGQKSQKPLLKNLLNTHKNSAELKQKPSSLYYHFALFKPEVLLDL
ncbi:alginate lyase family protein [uncultured Paraglaciecola sp.]|uniref:alginate lyase family protein n=1 Tax=uncultured Paraglaciecola sp. TaxID=1765024 RepID=UPI0030DBC1EA|tara:strand:- start:38361 stop:39575 length:1215 start_codon:yes stop_codon:yes gene_type:complete